MKDKDLVFDRSCHALYTKQCKQKIQACIASHYSEQKRCDKWKDYDMRIEPYSPTGPLKYKFFTCPVAEFAREHNLVDILPALCNSDYAAMEQVHARLVRTTTLGKGDCCDYAICGDKDSYLAEHEEYRDACGGRWNK